MTSPRSLLDSLVQFVSVSLVSSTIFDQHRLLQLMIIFKQSVFLRHLDMSQQPQYGGTFCSRRWIINEQQGEYSHVGTQIGQVVSRGGVTNSKLVPGRQVDF